jgi:CheY-like chemotaxis protein
VATLFRITFPTAGRWFAPAIIRLGAGGDEDDPPRSGASPSAQEGAALRSILIVEDELFVAWHIEDIVQSLQSYAATIVASGEEALAALRRAPADLVLMDVNLGGGLDGIEATKRIAEISDIPIIFITAYSDARTMERIREAAPGAAVLQKPVSAEALRKAVERALAPRPN